MGFKGVHLIQREVTSGADRYNYRRGGNKQGCLVSTLIPIFTAVVCKRQMSRPVATG